MKRIIVLLLTVSSMMSFGQLDSIGTVSGYWRNFFMYTDNSNRLQDWSALATGGMLKFETRPKWNLKLVAAGYSSHSLGGNWDTQDTITKKYSRYESGLFDVSDFSKKHIVFMGELYAQYNYHSHDVKVGRMKLKTPFLNPEDGRMIPVLEQGIWYTYTPKKGTKAQIGWITHIAPRSYTGFRKVEETIGIYPVGLNPDGSKSGYNGNLSSKGLGVFSLKRKMNGLTAELWDYYLENIFNTAYTKLSYRVDSSHFKWKFSGQFLIQNQLGNGGSAVASNSYFQDDLSIVWGARIELQPSQGWFTALNFNRFTGQGRFLFPREWGRETLFTFQKRERMEGVGGATSWVWDIEKKWKFKNKNKASLKLGYGHYYRPEPTSFEINKYAMPANGQLNLDAFYHFNGKLKGIVMEYLVTYKHHLGEKPINYNHVLNKVNMWNHNFIINYHFSSKSTK